MRIIGHGIDLVEVARIAQTLERHGQSFLDRCFTPGEQAYATGRKRRDEHLAGRFAAKEAVLKALGTGWVGGIAWTDVEVVLLPTGQPTVALHGRAAQIAANQGVTSWFLSISHTDSHAMASALSQGE